MVVEKFLAWAGTASAEERADGVAALARAYLYGDLSEADRKTAELSLTAMLDDPSAVVRAAMAEALASAMEAPHHIIVALANDHHSVSVPLLQRSPLLSDSELVDCAGMGDGPAQTALATRPYLAPAVCSALAEVGTREAVITLAVNDGAEISDEALLRIVERFEHDSEVREAVLQRLDLPPHVRLVLATATARALSDFVASCGWLTQQRAERVSREAREKTTVMIAAAACQVSGKGARRFAAHLRQSGQLTAGLVLRALLSGNRGLFEAALCELSGLPAARVSGLVDHWRGAGFEALYRKAQLPESVLSAFRAALDALHDTGMWVDDGSPARLSRVMVGRVIRACEGMSSEENGKLMAMLRRFEAEAARDDARDLSQSAREADDTPVPEIEVAAKNGKPTNRVEPRFEAMLQFVKGTRKQAGPAATAPRIEPDSEMPDRMKLALRRDSAPRQTSYLDA